MAATDAPDPWKPPTAPTGTFLDFASWDALPSEAQSAYNNFGQQVGLSGEQYFKFMQQNAPTWQNAGQNVTLQQNPATTATLQTLAALQQFKLLQGQGGAANPSGVISGPQGGAGTYYYTGGAGGTTGAPGAGTAGTAGTAGAGWGTGAGESGGGTNMATTTAGQIPTGMWGQASPSDIAEWQKWYGANVGKTILVNGQPVTLGTSNVGDVWNAFQRGTAGFGTPTGPQAPAAAANIGATTQPESVALQQMAQIDPQSEALRQQLAGSYLTPLQQAAQPTAGMFQNYLNLYGQVDPTGLAARQQLGTDLAAQEALGTQLDPATQRQVEQATREAQIARGNVYGTPQLVQEAMTTGQAGLALQQQRQQALQSYLSSGQTPGDVAMNLYNQQQNQLRAAQGAAAGYLGSGTTPYQAGASYLNNAQQQAALAAQGGPQYNPQALGQSYTGAGAPSYPQYGLDMSQLAGNWYNNINQANLQAYGLQQQSRAQGGAQAGALGGGIGTALGGIVGSVIPGVGTAIGGAVGGALGSAAGSYIG